MVAFSAAGRYGQERMPMQPTESRHGRHSRLCPSQTNSHDDPQPGYPVVCADPVPALRP